LLRCGACEAPAHPEAPCPPSYRQETAPTTTEEVTEIVRRACQDENKMEITQDDFYLVMTKKTFP